MHAVKLNPEERIDDLLTHQLKIIQSDEVFSFSLDAVLLARFSQIPPKGHILDLCTGNGVIPLLLTPRTRASITGVEIQERLYDMAVRSVRLNGLEDRIRLIQGDLKTVHEVLGYGRFDHVTVNPPYLPPRSGQQNVNPYVASARHEIHCTLEEVVAACARLVKSGGKVSMVHRPARLADIVDCFRSRRLEPKRIRFVHPRIDEEANMVLIEAIKDGGTEVRLLPPMIVFEKGQIYTPELQNIFYGRKARDSRYANSEEL